MKSIINSSRSFITQAKGEIMCKQTKNQTMDIERAEQILISTIEEYIEIFISGEACLARIAFAIGADPKGWVNYYKDLLRTAQGKIKENLGQDILDECERLTFSLNQDCGHLTTEVLYHVAEQTLAKAKELNAVEVVALADIKLKRCLIRSIEDQI